MNKNILASIIIPVYNNLRYTKLCLKSLVEYIDLSYFENKNSDYEVILIDNASTDGTREFLKTIKGTFKQILNEENLGFSKACNMGAKVAQGKYLIFLNNDTFVQPLWLESLIDFMEAHPDCGACGSKLLNKEGHIQEAGSIVCNDGLTKSFGAGKKADRPLYNKVCEVDYCSGASLCIRKTVWEIIKGFDEENFSPAYYEDVDICFAIRKAGYKVYYNPKSCLYHYGSVTSDLMSKKNLDSNVITNRNNLINKWWNELKCHLDFSIEVTTQDRNILLNPIYQENLKKQKKLLVYFSYSLNHITSGAHARIFDIISYFQKFGYQIIYVSTDLYDSKNNDAESLQELYYDYQIKSQIHIADKKDIADAKKHNGICISTPQIKSHFKQVYDELKPDVVLLNCKEDFNIIDFEFCKNSVLIIDIINTFKISNYVTNYINDGLRFIRNNINNPQILQQLNNSQYRDLLNVNFIDSRKNDKITPKELNVYKLFDIALSISEKEFNLINDNQDINAFFLPQIFEPQDIKNTYSDVPIFIVGESPLNLQAYLFFALKVLPIILKEEPNFKLKVFGEAAKSYPEINGIELIGYVDKLDDIYKNAAFSISPLLTGTGQQVRTIESMSYGIPVIMLDCLKDSTPINHEVEGYIAKDEYEFANYCLKLFKDRKLASQLGSNAKETSKRLYCKKQEYFSNLISLINKTNYAKVNSSHFFKNSIENTKISKELINDNINIKLINSPLVSVIMPVYNKSKFLQESIQSVVNQDYPNVELIIVNDGSTDNSLEVAQNEIKKYSNSNITIYSTENLGVAHARNYGFFKANGDFLMNFDADDILCPTYISKCIEQITKTNSDVCFSNIEIFGNEVSQWIPNEYNPYTIKYDNQIPSSAIFKNTFLGLTHGQKVALGFGEDWEFWVNMSRYNIKVTRVNEKLFRYRVTGCGIMETYIKDSYTDTLIQVMMNNSDLYTVSEVFKFQTLIPNMKSKSIDSINVLCKKHPYEWYPYFINGVLSESQGDFKKAIEYYELSTKLSKNTNWQALYRWAYLMKTSPINIQEAIRI